MITIGTKTVNYSFIEPDILVLEYADNIVIDVKAAEENHKLLLEYLKDKPKSFKLLVLVCKNMEVTPEARITTKDYNKELEDVIQCQAIVCPNYMAKVLAYIYMKVLAPKYPSRTFTNKEKAIKYLQLNQ